MAEKGVAGISMIKYLKKIFVGFLEEMKKSARGTYPDFPRVDYLFKTRDGEEIQRFIPEEQAPVFNVV